MKKHQKNKLQGHENNRASEKARQEITKSLAYVLITFVAFIIAIVILLTALGVTNSYLQTIAVGAG